MLFLRNLLTYAANAVAVCSFASVHAGITTETITMRSAALDRETTYMAALPDPLESGKNYPVLYLLHGAYGSYVDWTEKSTVTEALDGRDMIVIMPDGGEFGWYLDSSIKSNHNYDTAISKDLVQDVDSRFPTVSSRDGRGIAGLSMGGHGALSLAAKHPELYSSASSLSGILNVSAHPGKWGLDDILGSRSLSLQTWTDNSVLHLADNFTTGDVALLFDTGVGDETGAVEDNRRTHEALSNRKVQHTYREYPGTHNWEYWGGHIDEHLDFHQDNFTTRAAGYKPLTNATIAAPPRYTTATLSYETENRDLKQAEVGTSKSIVLLGSSTFAGTTSTLFPDYYVVNRGIGADRLGIAGINFGLLHRLYCSVFDVQPDAILINNGTNDLYHTAATGAPTVEEAAAGMDNLIGKIMEKLPDTPVLIVSCHSTREKSAQIAPLIKPYNELTKKLTGKYKNVVYVDTYSPTVGEDGLLKPEYSRDGLHLNEAGYEILARLSIEALRALGI